MNPKLVRITTVPISLEKLLEGQLSYMQNYFNVTAVSADKDALQKLGQHINVPTYHIEMSRQITPWKDLKAVFKLYQFFKMEQVSIVHTHTPKAGIVGMMASYFAKVPLRLHTVAGLPLMEAKGAKRNLLNLVEKCTYKFATKVYPNSKGLYDFILSEKLTSQQKLQIIGNASSNGIDTSHFDPNLFTIQQNLELRTELNIATNSFVFIFVGRLVGDKGINELIEAYTQLRKAFPAKDTTLLLVGPFEHDLDPLQESTLQAIDRNASIISVGYQQDVRPYFAMSDALVFPSYREGFPNVVMQAGAMGLPCIVTDINGCNEIIEHKVNGIIISSKDAVSLTAAMSQLLSSDPTMNLLSSNARKMIVERYERREVWEALLQEYQSLLLQLDDQRHV
ncbi:MAG: glycosyltransferase involved in cell wall biosynthesis [Nonlabens sp.]|jgi:glycosyltransferase involved in cell wall biosynthesis|uniref:glycosyltransferase family 4 protein n=1 Tax=Nonlabens sp. TaxID=1888209 RepID=UPI0039E40314